MGGLVGEVVGVELGSVEGEAEGASVVSRGVGSIEGD